MLLGVRGFLPEIEHVFDLPAILEPVEEMLDQWEAAVALLSRVEVRSLSSGQLADGALRVQRLLDLLTLFQGRLLAEGDNAGVWRGTGARNMVDWLAGATKTSHGDASDSMKLGESAAKSPELADAVANGELSAQSALQLHSAITSASDGAAVASLVADVKGASPSEARQAAEKWKELNRPIPETPEAAEERRYQRRSVTSGPPIDGLVTSTVVLPVLSHRQFINAISSLGGKPSQDDDRTTAQRLADGLVLLADAYAKGEVKGGRERATILLTTDASTFSGDDDHDARTANGDRIPAHIARRLAQDASLQRVLRVGAHILELGRQVRWPTDAQYRALVVRDSGCRWPGCTVPAAWCDVDHLVAFTNGGRSDLSNLWLLCRHHHTEKHRPGVVMVADSRTGDGRPDAADTITITLASGVTVRCAAPARRPSAAA